jgi:hypothetical protein
MKAGAGGLGQSFQGASGGTMRPLSSRATTGWVVPMRSATSSWVSPARLRASITAAGVVDGGGQQQATVSVEVINLLEDNGHRPAPP